ncbi:PAS domain [Macleaya cordata]|uniref:PAS domain n=1 Tax=Macleaya cordata TaxID=56857 RepID=A0A200QAM6_MACCD|nr:PAS domain [Macleaya cordata]
MKMPVYLLSLKELVNQSFGCMLAVEEPSFRIMAYSENTIELLGIDKQFKDLLGLDARTLFIQSSGESLTKATGSRDISLFNPVSVLSINTQKHFYAILHRIDVGIVIDFEPVRSSDPAFSVAGAMQSHKFAVQAISRLQSVPSGDIGVLCDTLVEEIQELTAYDRVMVYKFHEDEHGEVASEMRRSDLEPYLGLHYPATDIPQAARFLFKQNRVRMIYDCHADPDSIIQSQELKQPLLLVNSTLRSPHACHTQYMANMGSIASLVLAIVVNGNGSTKLWGLVACHHCSPRYVPFPLRNACEFLIQAFSLQLNMELKLLSQLEEKKILKTKTLLCDMFLRDVPFGIVTQSPNIMDLVKCDGAALYYGGTSRLLGVTPNELQIKDIADWLLTYDSESTGLTTDSLADAGYPGAALFRDVVCGMASVRISSNDFLFWFRSHTAKEIKWGGAKHRPEDKDNDGMLNPRSSFKAFLEVVKDRSLPWDVLEMNAIHSLQLILRGQSGATMTIYGQLNSLNMEGMDELKSVACKMIKIIETAMIPVFAVDTAGIINGWNAKIAELTGLKATEAMGKSLVNELVHNESRESVENHLSRALQGHEDKNIQLKLRTFGLQQQNQAVFIVANACTSKNFTNNVIGACFVGQDVTEEKATMDKFIRLQGDYKAIIQSLDPLIPPIFASDENACCCEWNTAMEKLTGWTKGEALGKMIPGEIFGKMCRLKDQGAVTEFTLLLYQAICSQVTLKFPFAFFDRKAQYMQFVLTASKRTDMGGNIIGCFCFLQKVVPDLQLDVQHQKERKCLQRLEELPYIQEQMKIPLDGIQFTHKLLESTSVSDEMKQLLKTSDACERQMMKIIEDSGLESIEEGSMVLNMDWFLLGTAMDAIVSQVMILLTEKKLQLIYEISEKIRTLSLYGDQIRLQQVFSAFLLHIVHHTPSPDGWVEIKVEPTSILFQDSIPRVQLQFRMTHPGQGLPSELIQDMVGGGTQWSSQEAHGLSLSWKLLKMMNGQIHYIREPNKCFFLIDIEFQTDSKTSMEQEDVNRLK